MLDCLKSAVKKFKDKILNLTMTLCVLFFETVLCFVFLYGAVIYTAQVMIRPL